jgi:mono/diheme cytochrome c family protein
LLARGLSGLHDTYGCRNLIHRTLLGILIFALLCPCSALVDNGAEIYKKKCAACHGATGAGDTMIGKNLKIRSLRSPEVQNRTDEELFNIIARGRNRMPSFDRRLSKEQIHDLVRYIRALDK